MDGVECTKRIRASHGREWPHIINVTADVFPGMNPVYVAFEPMLMGTV